MQFWLLTLFTQLRKIISERWRPSCRTHARSLSSKFCITFTNIFGGTVSISSRMVTFRSSIGRPRTARTSENVESVRRSVTESPRRSIDVVLQSWVCLVPRYSATYMANWISTRIKSWLFKSCFQVILYNADCFVKECMKLLLLTM